VCAHTYVRIFEYCYVVWTAVLFYWPSFRRDMTRSAHFPSRYDAPGSFTYRALLCVRENRHAREPPGERIRQCGSCLLSRRGSTRAYLVSAMSDCNGVRVRAIREIYRYMSDGIAQSTFVKRYILLHYGLISAIGKRHGNRGKIR